MTRQRRSGVFIVNFEHFSHFFLIFASLTLNKYLFAGLLLLKCQFDTEKKNSTKEIENIYINLFKKVSSWKNYRKCLNLFGNFGVYRTSFSISPYSSECGKIRTRKLRIWTLFPKCTFTTLQMIYYQTFYYIVSG